MYFWTGDRPLSAVVLAPTRAGQRAIDWAAVDGVGATLVRPNGDLAAVAATVDREPAEDGELGTATGTITVDWRTVVFEQAGVWTLRLTLLGAEGTGSERVDAVAIIVQAEDGWHTLPSARADWRDAPDDDRQLWQLLSSARRSVLVFAPELPEGAPAPDHYRQAQLMQARNLWNAGRVDTSGNAGTEGFALTPFPLDWQIKQLLRPKTVRPVAL